MRLRRTSEWAISDYFQIANQSIADVLKAEFDIQTHAAGISDLAVGEKKILGSSLHLSRETALYLSTFLVEMNVLALDRYLAHPSREPDYRKGRSHSEFLTDVKSLTERKEIGPSFGPREVATHLTHYLQNHPTLPWDNFSD
jgi:lipoate-protein ligase A